MSKNNVFKKEKFKKSSYKKEPVYIAPDFIKNNMDIKKIYNDGLVEHNNNVYSIVFLLEKNKNSDEEIEKFMNDLRIANVGVRFINDYTLNKNRLVITVEYENIDKNNDIYSERIDTVLENIKYSANANNINIEQLDLNSRFQESFQCLSEFYDTSKINSSLWEDSVTVLNSLYNTEKSCILENGKDYIRSINNNNYYCFVNINKTPYDTHDLDQALSTLSFVKMTISDMTPISDYNLIKNWMENYVGIEGLRNRLKRSNEKLFNIYEEYKKDKTVNDQRRFCYLSKTYLIEAASKEELEKNFNSMKALIKSLGYSQKLHYFEMDKMIFVASALSNRYSKALNLYESSKAGKYLIPYEKTVEDDVELLKNYFMS